MVPLSRVLPAIGLAAIVLASSCSRNFTSADSQTNALLLMLYTFSSEKRIFTANNLTPTVSMFRYNPASDQLAGVGDAVVAAVSTGITVDTTGKYLYVTLGNNSVAMFLINHDSLTYVNAVGTDANPSDVTISPDGRFIYVPNRTANTIGIYSRNPSDGSLTATGSAAPGTGPVSIAFDPTGQFAFVPNFGTNNVSAFTVNRTTGALTNNGTVATGTGPNHLLVHSTGRFAYACNNATNNVSVMLINSSTGTLTANGAIAAGTTPSRMAFDYSGNTLYVANAASNNISIYSIDPTTGALTAIGSVAAGSSPRRLALNSAGLFVSSFGSNSLLQYAIGSNGAISQKYDAGTGSGPIGVAATQ